MVPRDVRIARLEAALRYTSEVSTILAAVERGPRTAAAEVGFGVGADDRHSAAGAEGRDLIVHSRWVDPRRT
jgi:hypothetical protein